MLLMVPIAVQKFFNLIYFHLLNKTLVAFDFGIKSRNITKMDVNFCYFLGVFSEVSLFTFMPFLHFEFIFKIVVGEGGR